ncbi:MAG: hypothetical protein J6R04_03080 [Clostridia bacterium]|nr:hypothetical protein [Clostridia bacterium]
MKNQISRVFRFFLCNLISLGISFVVMLIALAFYNNIAEDTTDYRAFSDLIFNLAATLLLGFSMYWNYFLMDKEYKRHYLTVSEENKDRKINFLLHLKAFGKYDLLSLLILSVPIALIPYMTLGKVGIGFLIVSISAFFVYIPVQFIAALCWDIYVILAYLVCLWFAQKKWEKERLRK